LIALSPDVVLATAGSIVGAFQQASRTVPIVFVTTVDPVGGGWVESLSRPGTNATNCRIRGAKATAGDVRDPRVRQYWWPHLLWRGFP
jgi:ABC transporter substrate binding protein